MNLPQGNEVDMPRDNKSSCEREVALAPGQSLPQGSSLSRVHVNMPFMTFLPNLHNVINLPLKGLCKLQVVLAFC